jgi:Ni,Fe-hydrogenase I large subunit
MGKQIFTLPINRVEGDLELRIRIDDGHIADAWSAGIMYRGFENIMRGRAPLDALVITPRVCGICTTAHLTAAAQALDEIFDARVPDNGKRVRNICLGAEILQNDARHSLMLYMCDFANPQFQNQPLFDQACRRYQPLRGRSVQGCIAATQQILEIVAILGGQWPHSSFMVPGGVVSVPSRADLSQCRYLLDQYRNWYEKQILGCAIERWLAVQSHAAMDRWLDENPSHADSDLGFFIRFARAIGLDRVGAGHGHMLSVGLFDDPGAAADNDSQKLLPAGFFKAGAIEPFQQEAVSEDISHAWYADDEVSRHPFDETTTPYATGNEGPKYSWCKAPRYHGLPAETGPLAELAVAGNPLIRDILHQHGPSAWARQLARIIRPAIILPKIDTWLQELMRSRDDLFQPYQTCSEGRGIGLVEAPRGALGHWVQIENNRICQYQIITPTAWNASPRDALDVRGPWEQALLGVDIADSQNPIEAGLVIRSFDPCLVCTVHAVSL